MEDSLPYLKGGTQITYMASSEGHLGNRGGMSHALLGARHRAVKC